VPQCAQQARRERGCADRQDVACLPDEDRQQRREHDDPDDRLARLQDRVRDRQRHHEAQARREREAAACGQKVAVPLGVTLRSDEYARAGVQAIQTDQKTIVRPGSAAWSPV